MNVDVTEAVNYLRNGGLICHACEGVWGFACNPFDETAVQRILRLKQRPQSKGLIVIAHDATQFEPELTQLDRTRRSVVESSWPGRTTWLLPTTRFPRWITGDFTTVAARVPEHDQARSIAARFNQPIVSTSANVANETPCATEVEVREKFGSRVDCIVSGAIGGAQGASDIFDGVSGARVR